MANFIIVDGVADEEETMGYCEDSDEEDNYNSNFVIEDLGMGKDGKPPEI